MQRHRLRGVDQRVALRRNQDRRTELDPRGQLGGLVQDQPNVITFERSVVEVRPAVAEFLRHDDVLGGFECGWQRHAYVDIGHQWALSVIGRDRFT
jgi:hypothetical protein